MNQHVGALAEATRPFRAEDAPAVAGLFQSVMLGTGRPAGSALIDYLRHYYLNGPFADPRCPALVYVSATGDVEGFGGRVAQPFRFKGRELRAAIVGNLMVRDHASAPLAGARLLRALKSGPQDLTLSETAGDASLAMWRQLKGDVLERHSLDFIRVLKPARYAVDLLSTRISATRFLRPMTSIADRFLAAKGGAPRWTGLPEGFKPERGIVSRTMTPEEFAQLFIGWTESDVLSPVWPKDCLPEVVAEAMSKRAFGTPHLRVAATATGKAIGAYLFHFSGSGAARVTDIVHAPGQAGPTLDALFSDAQSLGASCVIGRTTPQLFDALLSRRALFAHMAASVIAANDPDVATAFAKGEAHFNGLVGERWTRLIGDRFDLPQPTNRENA